MQSQLEECKNKKAVFESISWRMNDAGFYRTTSKCHEKIKKLRVEYKKVKDNNNQTGNNRKIWKFYERIDSVLGRSKPATRPPIGIDSFDSSSTNNYSDSQKSDDDLEHSSESTSNNEQSSDLSTEKLPSDLFSDQVDEQCDKKPPAKR